MVVRMSDLKSGDVLLFYHKEGLLSNAIRWVTGSWVSHVGLVIKDPPGRSGLFLIESSLENRDGILGEGRFGVQVQPLASVTAEYDQVWVRRLTLLHGNDCTDALWNGLLPIDGDCYDWNPMDWIAAAIDNWRPGTIQVRRDNTFWCSALSAYLYAQMGLIDGASTDWTLVSPGEWLHGGDRQGCLTFARCSLSPETPLDVGLCPNTMSE